MVPLSIKFKNKYTVHEKVIKCTVKNTEFNLSYNPTLFQSGSLEQLKPFVTEKYFAPYVTTIGLYDDFNNLLAVAKFAQPIPMSANTDYNFIIKLDR
jgi:hypothetical protein